MQYRLLNSSGTVCIADSQSIADGLFMSADSSLEDPGLVAELQRADRVVIEIQSVADGRGFSVAAELREDSSFAGRLIATGKMNPDQLTLAFQCGFDGVVVDEQSWARYGEAAWLRALEPVVDNGYLSYKWRAVESIWEHRALSSESAV